VDIRVKKKILITGSTGLLGSEAVKLFEELGDWEVYGIDNNMRAYFFGTPDKVATTMLDIRDRIAVLRYFNEVGEFDAIIHSAAQPSHEYSKQNPLEDFDINTVGTLNLLEATRLLSPEAVFVNISSDKVYGENMKRRGLKETYTRWHHDKPYDEKLKLDQAMRSPFGCGKLAADLYVQEYGRMYGMKTVCFRPGCITGGAHEGAEQHGFLAYLAKCVKEGKKYTIFGYKGKQVRDQIHGRDLALACLEFIEKPKVAAVYNIGGGPDRSISVLEAIDVFEDGFKTEADVVLRAKPRKGDRQWDVHDVSKFRKDYPNWDYQYSLNDILVELVNRQNGI
jgi:CDP-paratose 2-epimerase